MLRRSGVLSALQLCCGVTAGLLAFGFTPGLVRTAVAANTSTLTKSAQDVTHPGASLVDHGDVVNWVVGYTDNGSDGPAQATITDPITGASTAQTYVPGSLKVPPGWTPSWSTDGTTFQPADPGSTTVAVRAGNPTARPNGTSLGAPLPPPLQASTPATGGDGFTPILYRADGKLEAWNIYHHAAAAAPKVVCTDLLTGAPCAGGPWPKPLNTAVGPLGTGATGDIATTLAPRYVLDPTRPGVVYYPAFTATAVGVGCLDMGARANCGFFPLQDTGGTPSSVRDIAGLVTTAGNLYGVSTTGQVLCLSIASRTPCPGQPYPPIVVGNHDLPGPPPNPANFTTYYWGALAVAGGKVLASSAPYTGRSTTSGPPALGCFDPATSTVCAGWSTPHTVGPDASYFTFNAYTSYDSAGAENGVCTTTIGPAPPLTGCYAINGAPLPPAGIGFSGPAGLNVFNPQPLIAPDGHRHSYFPVWGGGIPGATGCYDWNTAASCAGFPAPAFHSTVNGGHTRDYGYAYDATTGCFIGLGDAGVLFSEDPATGVSPCQRTGAAVTLNPAAFYCDGGTGHIEGYERAYLQKINVANVDLAASTVKVTDPGGATIATLPFAPDGSVDLSGVSYAAHPTIVVTTNLALKNNGDFTPGNQPNFVVTFRGDVPQVCFQTTVTAACTVTGVSNTANGSDTTGTFSSNTVDLPVAPGPNCLPKVSIDKEICDSPDPRNCGPGGSGPWVKKSSPGLLHLLRTAYWRITVTNEGPLDVTQVTINDEDEPSCAKAAGTFDLPAGTSKQFFCSTLIRHLPCTNTASATYHSPVDLNPITTPPSGAEATRPRCPYCQKQTED